MRKTHFDEEGVRYRLVKEGEGPNWIFFPGGPGCDSSLFDPLVACLHVPGSFWLIDLPGSGDNREGIDDTYDFSTWFALIEPIVSQFENPILVGQSFGGILALFRPILEQYLKGLVLIGSAPSSWRAESERLSAQLDLPDRKAAHEAFVQDPSDETMKLALIASLPRLFHPSAFEQGKLLYETVPFNHRPGLWLKNAYDQLDFEDMWVPQKVPTLVIGGTHDCICPYSLFERDERYGRENITQHCIVDAGHIPWIEKPAEVSRTILEWFEGLSSSFE